MFPTGAKARMEPIVSANCVHQASNVTPPSVCNRNDAAIASCSVHGLMSDQACAVFAFYRWLFAARLWEQETDQSCYWHGEEFPLPC